MEAKLGGIVGGGIGVTVFTGWRGGVMGECGGASRVSSLTDGRGCDEGAFGV